MKKGIGFGGWVGLSSLFLSMSFFVASLVASTPAFGSTRCAKHLTPKLPELARAENSKLVVVSESLYDFSKVVERNQLIRQDHNDREPKLPLAELQTFAENPKITRLTLSPSGQKVLLSFESGEIVLLDEGHSERLVKLKGQAASYFDFRILQSDQLLFLDENRFLYSHAVDNGMEVFGTSNIYAYDLLTYDHTVLLKDVSHDKFYVAPKYGKIYYFEYYNNQLYSADLIGLKNSVKIKERSDLNPRAVALSPSGEKIAITTRYAEEVAIGKATAKRLQSISLREKFAEHGRETHGLKFIGEDVLAFALDNRGTSTIVVYDVPKKSIIRAVTLPEPCKFESFSDGGSFVVATERSSGSPRTDVVLFDVSGGAAIEVYRSSKNDRNAGLSSSFFAEKTSTFWMPTVSGKLREIRFQ